MFIISFKAVRLHLSYISNNALTLSDIFLISDDYEDTPLEFNNSVPEASITMEEVVPFSPSVHEDLVSIIMRTLTFT
jgi:hypothetical protein